MNAPVLSAALLASAVVIGCARLLWQSWRAAPLVRPRPWRTALLMLGQAVAATLLYLAMFPPAALRGSDTLIVITARSSPDQIARIDRRDRVVALPEAPAVDGVERSPDLATALRRHPTIARLNVIGVGLPRRDLDAASGLEVEFDPAPLPRGIAELDYPQRVPNGATWRLTGVLDAAPGATLELLDPSQRTIARTTPEADGRFALQADAPTPGNAMYQVRAVDAAGKAFEHVSVPLRIVAGAPLRVLMLSGAPSPELKYLRRWALDAGVDLRSEIVVRPGMRVVRSSTQVTTDALRDLDLVILDERAWRSLGSAGRRDLEAALREGLGVLLRVTGTLSTRERDELETLGFDVRSADMPRTVQLAGVTTPLTRTPLQVAASDGVPLLRTESGQPLALWRAEGQGRIALWWLGDSFRMTLDGASTTYGTLWSRTMSSVARARGSREPAFAESSARIHQRLVICEVDADAQVSSPDGKRIALLRDASSGCAAFWPATVGWQVLSANDARWPFYVRSADEAAALAAYQVQSATLAIASKRTTPMTEVTARRWPGSPWPYLLACLVALGATWWLERSRAGRQG